MRSCFLNIRSVRGAFTENGALSATILWGYTTFEHATLNHTTLKHGHLTQVR